MALILLWASTGAADPIRMAAIGDSITFGISSEPRGPGYVSLLSDTLGEDFEVTNLGCSGSIAGNWRPDAIPAVCGGDNGGEPLDYWDDRVLPAMPADVVTIMLGTNDAQRGIEAWLYRAFLVRIIDGLQAEGVSDILLMTPPPHPSEDPNVQILLTGYVSVITHPTLGLCTTFDGVRCGPDVYHLLDSNTDFAAGDGHPNAMGHQKIADSLAGFIVPEPSSGCLLAGGLLVLAIGRRAAGT
jgi:lysophospholipase L1-like esterase